MKRFDIAELAKINGAENIRFFFPARPLNDFFGICFTSSDDETTVVEAKAVEKYNRKVSNGYKIILQPLDEKFAYEDYYISVYESLCKTIPEEFYIMIGNEKVSVT